MFKNMRRGGSATIHAHRISTEHKEAGSKRSPDIYSVIGTITGCIALAVSVWSSYSSDKGHSDTSGAQLISDTYQTFYDLNKKQGENPTLSHMFVAPEDYSATAKLVRQSTDNLTERQKAEYLLKEKAISFYIFTVFEETFYQYKHAIAIGDKTRASFLTEVLNYFTGRLLRNPRLLYYWDSNGGNVAQYYEAETRKYYEEHVVADPSAPLKVPADLAGPYVASTAKQLGAKQ